MNSKVIRLTEVARLLGMTRYMAQGRVDSAGIASVLTSPRGIKYYDASEVRAKLLNGHQPIEAPTRIVVPPASLIPPSKPIVAIINGKVGDAVRKAAAAAKLEPLAYILTVLEQLHD